MKNLFIVFFISFLCMIELSITKATKSKNLKRQSKGFISQFTNQAYLKSKAIAAHNDNVWVCTSDNKLFKLNKFEKGISGTKPATCIKIATNKIGELYVIDDKKDLYFLKFMGSDNYNWKKTESKVEDVAVGFNNEVFFIDSDGKIFELRGDKKGSQFSKKTYKDALSIAVSFSSEQEIYVVDKDGNVYLQTEEKQSKLFPTILAKRVCVNQRNVLFISSGLGIYMKNPRISDLTLYSDGIAEDMDCGRYLWVVAEDSYIYSNEDSGNY